jgi:hypothetical protein
MYRLDPVSIGQTGSGAETFNAAIEMNGPFPGLSLYF